MSRAGAVSALAAPLLLVFAVFAFVVAGTDLPDPDIWWNVADRLAQLRDGVTPITLFGRHGCEDALPLVTTLPARLLALAWLAMDMWGLVVVRAQWVAAVALAVLVGLPRLPMAERAAGAARSSSSVPAIAKEGAPFGILEVRSRPWGRVLLDGVDTGITTPLLDYRVTPGAHRVRVQDPLTGREQGQGVEIREGETARLDLELLELSAEQRCSLVVAEERLVRPALP